MLNSFAPNLLQGSLTQLLCTLRYHEEVFSAKIKQIHAGKYSATHPSGSAPRGCKRCIFTPSPSNKHIRSASPSSTKREPLDPHDGKYQYLWKSCAVLHAVKPVSTGSEF